MVAENIKQALRTVILYINIKRLSIPQLGNKCF